MMILWSVYVAFVFLEGPSFVLRTVRISPGSTILLCSFTHHKLL